VHDFTQSWDELTSVIIGITPHKTKNNTNQTNTNQKGNKMNRNST